MLGLSMARFLAAASAWAFWVARRLRVRREEEGVVVAVVENRGWSWGGTVGIVGRLVLLMAGFLREGLRLERWDEGGFGVLEMGKGGGS